MGNRVDRCGKGNCRLPCCMATTSCAPVAEIDNMITNNGKGNEALCNLPRKINIALSPSRDDFSHAHINDVGLQAGKDPNTGEVSV